MLFRAGIIAPAAEQQQADLRNLGIAAIYDLRANAERRNQNVDWFESIGIPYHFHDYEISRGKLDQLIETKNLNPETARDAIHTSYRILPFEQAQSYRHIFTLLLQNHVPLLFNCTAGKDRTGVAAALILYALGVPREAIAQEYTLTERWTERLLAMILSHPGYTEIARLPRDHYISLFRADPTYLMVAFEEIEARHGTIENYLQIEIGIGQPEMAQLQAMLLE
jgi:protein-tyrosine phosphatase